VVTTVPQDVRSLPGFRGPEKETENPRVFKRTREFPVALLAEKQEDRHRVDIQEKQSSCSSTTSHLRKKSPGAFGNNRGGGKGESEGEKASATKSVKTYAGLQASHISSDQKRGKRIPPPGRNQSGDTGEGKAPPSGKRGKLP